jgi:hypothetical protein
VSKAPLGVGLEGRGRDAGHRIAGTSVHNTIHDPFTTDQINENCSFARLIMDLIRD